MTFKRIKNWDHIVILASFVLLCGCAAATSNKKEAKIPEKHRTLVCGEVKRVGNEYIAEDIRNKFIKQKGNKNIYTYTEWYDVTPYAEYTVKWEYYHKDQFLASSIKKFSSPIYKYMTASPLKLDPKYPFPTGIITCKVFINDNHIATAKFMLAENEKELAKLEKKFETESLGVIPAKAMHRTPQQSLVHGYEHDGQNWAIIVGISKYKYFGENGFKNLIFADDDAKAFSRVLINLGWKENNIKFLLNEEATQRNIMIALESWLTKASTNDQIVLFWAGHGFADPEDPEKVYFACYDTDISIPATGYRMDKVRTALEEREARNVVLFADTCHAGKLITRGDRGLSIVPQIKKMNRERNVPKGWIFMVGADTDRMAIEHSSWTNGAFTHCLVKALTGEADGYESVGSKDGIVTMAELRTYLNSAMPEETQRVLGVAKRPVITTSTGDPHIWDLTLQAK